MRTLERRSISFLVDYIVLLESFIPKRSDEFEKYAREKIGRIKLVIDEMEDQNEKNTHTNFFV